MSKSRRLIAIVCIVAVLVAGIVPTGAAVLVAVLVPLDPLVATILSLPVPERYDPALAAPPVLAGLPSRAPPIV